ncbi:MAG: CNNM domain-containing protein, partial [Candidatus Levyibacteriota bacterium]
MDIIPRILLLLLLIFFNGFFVAAEFALVSVRKSRIDELVLKGNKDARLVQKALNNINSIISSTQLGITLVSLALGWLGEPAIAEFFERFFKFLPKDVALVSSHTIAITLAFILITFIDITLGELTPKSIALHRTEKVTLMLI